MPVKKMSARTSRNPRRTSALAHCHNMQYIFLSSTKRHETPHSFDLCTFSPTTSDTSLFNCDSCLQARSASYKVSLALEPLNNHGRPTCTRQTTTHRSLEICNRKCPRAQRTIRNRTCTSPSSIPYPKACQFQLISSNRISSPICDPSGILQEHAVSMAAP
jgi:hypothetical protein